MKTTSQFIHRLPLFALLLGLVLALGARTALAASPTPPDLMSYQGYLVDVNGAPLAPTTPANYSIVFRIYDASSGGAILWSEQQIVTVDKGNFSVVLGAGTAVSGEARPALSSVFGGATASDRYLGITVTISGTTMTISPRLRLLPSAYAFAASKAITAITAITATAATTATTLVNSSGANLINTSGGNVGIGTTSPSAMLQIGEGANAVTGGLKIHTGWINGSDPTEARPLDVQVRGDTKLVVNTQGNVGIGTAAPFEKLSVNGGIGFANQAGGKKLYSPTDGTLEWMTHSFAAGHGFSISDQDGQKVYLNSAGNSFLNGGNGGIGTTSPAQTLDVNGKFTITDGGTRSFPGGIATELNSQLVQFGLNEGTVNRFGTATVANQGGMLRFDARSGEPVMSIYTRPAGENSGSGMMRLAVLGNGNVGIGTSSPVAPLTVDGFSAINANWHTAVRTNQSAPDWFSSPQTTNENVSIHASHSIRANRIVLSSDARIKEITGRTTGPASLESIRKLQVTDYLYVDKISSGLRPQRGLIAQEVEKVLPDAVSQNIGVVPDIYALALTNSFDAQSKALSITIEKPHGLKIDDVVRLIMETGPTEAKVIAVPSASSFVVTAESQPSKVFVFGKQVNDFRTVDYDRVFTTGIRAIQELDRQVQALQKSEARIAELEQKTARMAELEAKASRVDAMEKRVRELESVEQQVAELRKLVAELASAAPKASEPVAASLGPKAAIASANP